jgi:hypothetical protein
LSSEKTTFAADGWFAAKPREFFLDGLQKFEQQNYKCVQLKSEICKYIFSVP